MRHFSGVFAGIRLLMLDELDSISGGDGEDTGDTPPSPPEDIVVHSDHYSTEAVIDQCLEDGARVRLGTVIAAAPMPRPEYLFFDLSRSGKISNSRFE